MGKVSERAWAEINLSALVHNLRYAQARVGASVGILAVCKANSYGHGAVHIAREAEAHGARAIGVATPSEAIEIREAGIRIPVVVMGSCLEEEVEPSLQSGVSLSVSPGPILWKIVDTAKRLGRCAHVHLLVDTGMSRDGLAPAEALEMAEHIAETPDLHLEGTYTHLATSSMNDKSYCHEQLGRFNDVINKMLSRNISPGTVHCANSGGLFTLPSSHFDMVRQGITLYGVPSSEHVAVHSDLIPVMTVKTRVMALKDVTKGQNVGYLREFTATRSMKLATIAMGYADGFRLALSASQSRPDKPSGSVLINGRRAPVVGRVMMDCCVVDVTSIPGVRLGDEVVIIGKSGRNSITASDIGNLCHSSPYEVLCSFGRRVRRIYLRDSKPIITDQVSMQGSLDLPVTQRTIEL